MMLLCALITLHPLGRVIMAAQQRHTAIGLEVEHATQPLSVDVASPRFSWRLFHPQRAQLQTSFRGVIKAMVGAGDAVVWNSGTIASNATHVLYSTVAGGGGLPADADFSWSVVWADARGVLSQPANSTFNTAQSGSRPGATRQPGLLQVNNQWRADRSAPPRPTIHLPREGTLRRLGCRGPFARRLQHTWSGSGARLGANTHSRTK